MKSKYFKIILMLLVMGMANSCEDMLEVEVRSSITGQNYWKSESDFLPYLFSIYDRNRSLMGENMIRVGEERSDMWIEGYNNRFSFWDQNLTPGITYDWTTFYGTIGHCNLFLEQIDAFNFQNTTLKNQLKAEVLALRATTYFFLARVWGDVPIVLTSVKDENEPKYPRAPVTEVFKQINADITSSLGLFPSPGYTDKYRFSKPAVYALLAEVKMWSGKVLGGGNTDFQAAIDAISQVQASGVSLLSDFGKIFDTNNERNNEIILSVYCERYEWSSSIHNTAWLRFDTGGSADNVDDIPMRLLAQQGYAVSNKVLSLFSEFPQDKRISRTYVPELYNGVPRMYWQNKYRGTVYSDERYPDNDIVVYRLADLLLLKAEAYVALNQVDNALIELNKIRTRAGVPVVTSTDKNTVAMAILDERGRELFFESKRWFDLVRAHKSGLINLYSYIPTLAGKNTPIYWPVHSNVLQKNELLDQTEGY